MKREFPHLFQDEEQVNLISYNYFTLSDFWEQKFFKFGKKCDLRSNQIFISLLT